MTQIYEVDWDTESAVTAAIGGLIDVLHGQGRTSGGRPRTELFRRQFAQLQRCHVPMTAFTPAICRLFYELSYAAGPTQLVGVGTYAGTAMNLLAAGAVDRHASGSRRPVRAIGLDVDPQANKVARRNAQRMCLDDVVQYDDRDGLEYLVRLRRSDYIDLLLLDFDDPATGKAGYAHAFDLAASHMAAGAFVLAHDALVPKFREDLERLRDRVRSAGGFDLLIDVPIDRAGLLIAGRRAVPPVP